MIDSGANKIALPNPIINAFKNLQSMSGLTEVTFEDALLTTLDFLMSLMNDVSLYSSILFLCFMIPP